MIDVVLSDDVDLSNGSATPYPTNRIVIYANPPVSESALRYTNDWGQLVITHELTHIFHLERTRGIWSLGQHVFGRAAALFPNLYSPSWITEGLAVYEESKLTGAGRIEGSEHRMIVRTAALDHAFPSIGAISLSQGRYPFGETAYAFGSLFVDYLAKTQGDSARAKVRRQVGGVVHSVSDRHSRPSRVSESPSRTPGATSPTRSARSIRTAPVAPLGGWRELTRDGVFVYDPRWISDSTIIYSGSPGRESFAAFRVDLKGDRTTRWPPQHVGPPTSHSAAMAIFSTRKSITPRRTSSAPISGFSTASASDN